MYIPYIFRTNPVPKPPRGGEYGILPQSEQELAEYGPASYVPGDRYNTLLIILKNFVKKARKTRNFVWKS